jgi:hypothetical protein
MQGLVLHAMARDDETRYIAIACRTGNSLVRTRPGGGDDSLTDSLYAVRKQNGSLVMAITRSSK